MRSAPSGVPHERAEENTGRLAVPNATQQRFLCVAVAVAASVAIRPANGAEPWSTRAPVTEARQEVGVAELDG